MSAIILKPLRFAQFKTVEHKACVYIAEIRFVTNKKHPKYGMSHIFTTPSYTQITEHPLYDNLYMTEDNARQVLIDNDFIEVRPDFNAHDIDHLIEIKEILPDEWIECFNSWASKMNS